MEINAIDEHHLAKFRDYLLRYAIFRLRDDDLAEDTVQDTLLAALQSKESFTGQSTVKTWITGILKHKIIDAQRRACRDPFLIESHEDEDGDAAGDFDTLFDRNGHWGSDGPRPWAHPEAALEQRDFWRVYAECNERLPKRTAMVFAMRESLGYDIDLICQNLEITATNCSVLLYRARLGLRQCLEKSWFGRESSE